MLVWCQAWPGMFGPGLLRVDLNWSTFAVHVEAATPGCCLVQATSSHFRHLTEYLVRNSFLQGHWGQKHIFIWVLTRGLVVPLSTDCGKMSKCNKTLNLAWSEMGWIQAQMSPFRVMSAVLCQSRSGHPHCQTIWITHGFSPETLQFDS